ncbi:hypothetical protein HDK90DRAFT_472525 [Phyllosticta capitalensis]|uniref:Uncharacterized protein n=1 Tax=Phyllosticta capitalensis TaxID=121624 RepID=A0ABR1Z2S4_9PEZI
MVVVVVKPNIQAQIFRTDLSPSPRGNDASGDASCTADFSNRRYRHVWGRTGVVARRLAHAHDGIKKSNLASAAAKRPPFSRRLRSPNNDNKRPPVKQTKHRHWLGLSTRTLHVRLASLSHGPAPLPSTKASLRSPPQTRASTSASCDRLESSSSSSNKQPRSALSSGSSGDASSSLLDINISQVTEKSALLPSYMRPQACVLSRPSGTQAGH